MSTEVTPPSTAAFIRFGVAAVATTAAIVYAKTQCGEKEPPKTLLNEDVKYPLKLIRKDRISHNTRRFVFELPSKNHVLGLDVGKHIFLSANINGKLVVRPYTPVTSDDDKGHMDLVIKVYFSNQHPKYPDGGKMSQYLENLPLGQPVDVRGPGGLIKYKFRGLFSVRLVKDGLSYGKRAKQIGMIAGGTGITPMLQLIRQCLKDPNDKTKLWLIFANQTEDDILVRKELEECATKDPGHFKLWYTLDRAPIGWKYSTGFVDEQMIREHLPAPSLDAMIFLCGPKPMIDMACLPNLEKAGHQKSRVVCY
uniref:NADH-cytochrome b5 reductase n=1 Tax=Phallusia mammillata TaxID=59560 RepID=A0A6F9D9P2_9ASCI|nr:NADH-cytochrome b5 reductase 3-like [Phallusia mammillata]